MLNQLRHTPENRRTAQSRDREKIGEVVEAQSELFDEACRQLFT